MISKNKMTANLELIVERAVEKFNSIPENSMAGRTKKVLDFIYTVDVGGSLIREYQRRIAERIGWKEKNLTIANATIFGLGGSAVYFIGNYFFGDNAGNSFQDVFYGYPGFVFAQSLARITYAQITRKAIGSISVYNLVGSPIYAIKDFIVNRKIRK